MMKHLVKVLVLKAVLLTGFTFANAAVPSKLNPFQEGERVIYSRLVQSYRAADLAQVDQQLKVLERNYPFSVHLDNAIYLKASLEFQKGRMGEAVRSFNRVTDRFPKSGKRPAALFALAMCYKQLGLQPQALRVFNSILSEYPGSPESQRAQAQLQVAKLGSVKK